MNKLPPKPKRKNPTLERAKELGLKREKIERLMTGAKLAEAFHEKYPQMASRWAAIAGTDSGYLADPTRWHPGLFAPEQGLTAIILSTRIKPHRLTIEARYDDGRPPLVIESHLLAKTGRERNAELIRRVFGFIQSM